MPPKLGKLLTAALESLAEGNILVEPALYRFGYPYMRKCPVDGGNWLFRLRWDTFDKLNAAGYIKRTGMRDAYNARTYVITDAGRTALAEAQPQRAESEMPPVRER